MWTKTSVAAACTILWGSPLIVAAMAVARGPFTGEVGNPGRMPMQTTAVVATAERGSQRVEATGVIVSSKVRGEDRQRPVIRDLNWRYPEAGSNLPTALNVPAGGLLPAASPVESGAATASPPAHERPALPAYKTTEQAAVATAERGWAEPERVVPDSLCTFPIESSRQASLPAARSVRMTVTAYCPCRKCCGPKACGITASGKPVTANGGRFCAADRSIPFGTLIDIPGYGTVPVLDRGGAITDGHLDVFMSGPDGHRKALEWGRRNLLVTVYR